MADSDRWLQALPHFHCFGCDPHHPKGLRLRFDEAGPGRLRTRFTPSEEYVGAERFVHGGIIAVVFDDLMKWCLLRFRQRPHITVQMEQRFRHPVFSGTELVAEAAIAEDLPEGRVRLIAALAAAADPGTILAEGWAVFAPTPPDLLDLIPAEQQAEFTALFAGFTRADRG